MGLFVNECSEVKLNAVVEMKFSPFRTSVFPTTLTFERVGAVVEGRREKIWLYQGVADEQEDCRQETPLAKSA